MVASTLITIASIPVYKALFHAFSTVGLAMASDAGIAANTIVIALLLHRRKLVSLFELQWKELTKAGSTALVAGGLSYEVGKMVTVRGGGRLADIEALVLMTVTWAAAVVLGLWVTRSQLPGDLRRRKRTAYPHVAENSAADLSGGAEP